MFEFVEVNEPILRYEYFCVIHTDKAGKKHHQNYQHPDTQKYGACIVEQPVIPIIKKQPNKIELVTTI